MSRIYYLNFSYTDCWYGKILKGYTHVDLIARTNKAFVELSPLASRCFILVGDEVTIDKPEGFLRVRVAHSSRAQLIKPTIQTCTTFVQYVMGINVGAFLCQTLYDRLTTKQYPGIEVTKWQRKGILTLN